jgi:cytochrome c oxidase assembly protein subunit 15
VPSYDRPVRRLSPEAYRRVTLVALALLCIIVVSGGAVRLSGSGLGCTDWPNCEKGRLAPAQITDAPAMVEFTNRLVTGTVSAAVIVAVLGSLVRVPRRRDLTRLSVGLVAGVLAQIVLGGLVVLFDLSPRLVMGHFLLSLLIVWNALLLHHRAGQPDSGRAVSTVSADVRTLVRLIVVSASIVVFTGTVVTASGPHAGDSQAARLDFSIHDVARIHGVAVVLLLGLVLFSRRVATAGAVRRGLDVLLVVLLAQAAVGYTQYFTGVPALLVGVHLAGAVSVWIAATRLPMLTREVPAPAGAGLVGVAR